MERPGERHEDAGDEIGEDDVERWLAARHAARARRDASRDPVPPGVRDRGLDGDRIGIDPERARRAETDRGDGEDPRTAPHVEHARAVDDAAVGSRLERREAQARRRVQAGPERHPRVEGEDDVVRLAVVPAPGRPDDQPAADAQHREIGLPGGGPVLLVDDPGAQLADRPQPERLEVAERFGHLGDGGLGRGRVARGHVSADHGRPRDVDAGAEPLVDEIERGFDRRPAARDPAEDLADRFDRLEVHLDRELEPRAGTARATRPSWSARAPFPLPPRPPPQPRASRTLSKNPVVSCVDSPLSAA